MFPALFNAGVKEGIGFVDFAKAVQHFWQLRRIDGLNSNLDNGLGVELQRPKDVELLVAVQIGDGAGLNDGLINAFHKYPASGGHAVHFDFVSGLVNPKSTC